MVHTSKQPLLKHVCKCCVWNALDFSLHYLSFDNFRQDLRCLYIYMLRYVYMLFGICQTYLHFVMIIFDSWSFFKMMCVVFLFDQLSETSTLMKCKWSACSVCAYSAVQLVRTKRILLSVYGHFVHEFNLSTHLWHSLASK